MFIPIFGPLISAGLRSAAIDEMYAQLQSIKYEITSGAPDQTVVRIRMYNVKQEQMVNADLYTKEFKAIADAMFIQAIEITPAEQQ